MRLSPLNKSDARVGRTAALRLLARREHSREELRHKLLKRGIDAVEAKALLEHLENTQLLSDARFTESYIYARRARGFGPVRIRMELQARGVADSLIDEHLDERGEHWQDLLYTQYRKRYGDEPVHDRREYARRARFLQQRGFPHEMIRRLLDDLLRLR